MDNEEAELYRRWLQGKSQCGDYCDRCGDCLRCGGEMCINGGDHHWVIYPALTSDEKAQIEREILGRELDSRP